MFSITFTDSQEIHDEVTYQVGRIIAGSLNESFRSALDYLSVDQYRKQWMQALDDLINGASRSALITCFEKPEINGALDWWPLYLEGKIVSVRYQLLVLGSLKRPFDLDRFQEFVPPHKQCNEDGYQISEWSVSIQEIIDFRRNH
ncbi:MAG: hypothetical protein M3O30_19410 [Planctomycetota bacterium]|nr:hypothetical protein [Planctomycetota bacterium]